MSGEASPAQTCPGRRMADGARLGLCLTCALLTDTPAKGSIQPLARQERRGGTWGCSNYRGAGN